MQLRKAIRGVVRKATRRMAAIRKAGVFRVWATLVADFTETVGMDGEAKNLLFVRDKCRR